MICPNCQRPNRDGAKFCAHCRSQLPVAPTVPPAPAAIPPVNAPPAYSAPAPAATAVRQFAWKNFGIGCGVFLLGMICGMLALGGGSWGIAELQKRNTPAASPSVAATPGATMPLASPGAPVKPGGGGGPVNKPGAREGEKVPAFVLKDVNGQDRVFADLIKDKPAVLMFWKPEPRYEEMLAVLQNAATKGLVPVVVTPEKDATAIKKYIEDRQKDKLIVLVDGELVAQQYLVNNDYPSYFFIRRDGTLAKRRGMGFAKPDLEKELDELLK